MTTPSRDEFEAWAADPVTVFVMDGLRALAAKQEDACKEAMWLVQDGRQNWDDMRLTKARCRARAETFSDLAVITIEDAYGANGLEAPPKTEESAT